MILMYLGSLFAAINNSKIQKRLSRSKGDRVDRKLNNIRKEKNNALKNPKGSLSHSLKADGKNQKTSNPFVGVISAIMKSVAPIIASLSIPDIQPVLDIMAVGYTSITNQIASVFAESLSKIQTIVNAFTSSVSPQIENIINEGNIDILETITNSFNTAKQTVKAEVKKITAYENAITVSNISGNNNYLIDQILERLSTASDSVQISISTSLNNIIDKISIALAEENNNVFTQITNLLADVSMKEAILPQLMYADAAEIAEILSSDSILIFEGIGSVLNEALNDINSYIVTTNNSAVDAETTIVNNNNDKIVIAINDAVNIALDEIKNSIGTITSSEIDQITILIDKESSEVSKTIVEVIKQIPIDVESIITIVTELQLIEVKDIISKNNDDVKNQVNTILSTSI